MAALLVVALLCLIVGFAIGVLVVLRSSGFFQRLSTVTNTLERTLGSPSERGTWAEVKLRQVVEFAGMEPWCDFDEQVVLRDGSRPDMVIRLPGGWRVIVDSKATLDPTGLRSRMRELADRRYWESLPGSPDFVILFVPLESALSSALQQDPSLLEEAARRNVMFATPATLVTILRLFANGWRQETLTRNAATVREDGEQLYSRTGTALQHIAKVGRLLGQAVKAHNDLVASVDSRLLPSLRRMHEHGIGQRELELPAPVDLAVRELRSSWPEEQEQPQNTDDESAGVKWDWDRGSAGTAPAELAPTNGGQGGGDEQGPEGGNSQIEDRYTKFGIDVGTTVTENEHVGQPECDVRDQSDVHATLDSGFALESSALPITTDEGAGRSAADPFDGGSGQQFVESSEHPFGGVTPAPPVTEEVVTCKDHVHTSTLARLAGLNPKSLAPYVSQGKLPAPAGWCWEVDGERYWDNETAARWLARRRGSAYLWGASADQFIAQHLPPAD